jgi:hypothetical protein
MIPPNEKIVICFAHVAYQLHERFSALETGINSFSVRDPETLVKRVDEADVLVISGLWQNLLLMQNGSASFNRLAPAPTNSRTMSWQSAGSGSPVPAASMLARLRSTRWR